MQQVCISSDVATNFIIEDTKTFDKIGLLIHVLKVLENSIFFKIEKVELGILKEDVEKVLEMLIASRNHDVRKKTIVGYKNCIFELDLQNDVDFTISMLIDLYNLSATAEKLSGCVYIFNRDLVKKNKGDKIISTLKYANEAVSIVELKEKIESSLRSLNIFENCISQSDIKSAISTLKENGLIFITEDETIALTSRGCLFW